jgi:hypothetical protein
MTKFENGYKYRKIRVLKDIERESMHTGEKMSWKKDQFEEGYVTMCPTYKHEVEINWG